MPRYASQTKVSSENSRADIERTLNRYGIDGYRYSSVPGQAMIEFSVHNRIIRFVLPLPKQDEFRLTPKRRNKRSQSDQHSAWEQACRQRWRALLLSIKAKLEAVESQIATFEEEFMAHVVDPQTNKTLKEIVLPQIEANYNGHPKPIALLEGPTCE